MHRLKHIYALPGAYLFACCIFMHHQMNWPLELLFPSRFSGETLCYMSSASFLESGIDVDHRFLLVVLGQVITGLGAYAIYLGGEILEQWFDPDTKLLVGSILTFSIPFGTIFSGFLIPTLVPDAESIPGMNLAYFLATIPIFVLSFIFVSVCFLNNF